jgi:hypothetical protein
MKYPIDVIKMEGLNFLIHWLHLKSLKELIKIKKIYILFY